MSERKFWQQKRLSNKPPTDSIEEMLLELERHQMDSNLVHACFALGRARNLTREQTLGLLAYHAVRMYEEMLDREVDRVMAEPMPPFYLAAADKGGAMSERIEKLIESVAREAARWADMAKEGESAWNVQVILQRRLGPLLSAAEDMRFLEWPGVMNHGPAKDWDDAFAAAEKGEV